MGAIRSGRYASRKSPPQSGRAATIRPCSFPWLVRAAILPSSRKRSRMVAAMLSNSSARFPPSWRAMAVEVAIRSSSSEPPRFAMAAIASSKGSPSFTSLINRPSSCRKGALLSRPTWSTACCKVSPAGRASAVVDARLQGDPGAWRVGHLLQPVRELCVEAEQPPAPVEAHQQRRRKEAGHGRQRREEHAARPVPGGGEQQQRAQIEPQDLLWIEEEEHPAEIVDRARQVLALVSLERPAHGVERQQREEERGAAGEQRDEGPGHQGPLTAWVSVRLPRMIWIVRYRFCCSSFARSPAKSVL